ncbi:MAG: PQQ-binding-like beta-propeller repeat protein [Elusimicrobia bacterium]|nr:PQQ-binding-like beta-propeller repeat protein [Elusimicrobiota bacterium]
MSFLLVILNPLSFILYPSVYAGDWPTFRGNNQRTGFTAEQAYPPLTWAWEYPAGDIVSSPVVFEDIVYFGSRDNKIYALNARTGALAWKYSTGGWVDATPTVSSNTLYVPSMDGYLYALNRLNGNLLWRAALGACSVSSPLVLDGRIFAGTGTPEKKLKVFKASTGQLLFEYPANQPVDSAPSTEGVLVYFGANDGRIYAFNKNTFSPEWEYPTTGGRYGINAVAVSSGILYALPGYDENKPLAFNSSDGTLLNLLSGPFEESASWIQTGSPVVTKDRVYFSAGASANTLYAMASQPVEQALQYVWPSSPSLGNTSSLGILSSPAMANEIMYAGTAGGKLVSVSSAGVFAAADINILSPAYSSPAISNGMVFIGTLGGKLIAYKAAKTLSISSPGKNDIISVTVAVKGYVFYPANTLTGYTLEYSTGGSPQTWNNIISSNTIYNIEDKTLADWNTSVLANGVYTLKLTGLENPVSGTDNTAVLAVRVNAAPLAPSGLTAVDVSNDNGNQINLNWTASGSGSITAYKIYRKSADEVFTEITSVSSNTLTCIDATAVTGTTFTYTVRAFDDYVESENSNPASAYSINDSGDNAPPSAITNLSAVPGPGAGTVSLVWTAPGNDADVGTASHYLIRYTTISNYAWDSFDGAALQGSAIPVEGPAGDIQSQEIGGLFGGVTYYFAVKTADFIPNISALSNIATTWATPDIVPPQPPANLSVVDTPGDEGGSLTLTWTLSPDDGSFYNDVYGYKIYRRVQNSVYVSSIPYATVLKGVKKFIDSSASENIRFYYSVAAFDSTNNSSLSNEASCISADNWRFFDASQGASVRLPDGTRIDIPEYAASQNDRIMVSKLDPVTYQPLFTMKTNTQAKPTAIAYEVKFKNPNTKLIKPAVLTLPYTAESVAGMIEENLRIYTLSDGTWLIINTSKAHPVLKKVTAEVNHFSFFRIMEYVPSGALLNPDSVYTYPNPAKGDILTFKFLVADKSYVTVDVYNVAGEKTARLEKADCPGGVTSEIIWDIKNTASGVYVYRVQAKSASGEKSVTKKLAIIH